MIIAKKRIKSDASYRGNMWRITQDEYDKKKRVS
jgi:hypothetical protein